MQGVRTQARQHTKSKATPNVDEPDGHEPLSLDYLMQTYPFSVSITSGLFLCGSVGAVLVPIVHNTMCAREKTVVVDGMVHTRCCGYHAFSIHFGVRDDDTPSAG